MSEAKPICIIKIDMMADFGGGKRPNLREIAAAMEDRLRDYHVFVLPQAVDQTEPHEPIIFQVFYSKDFTDIDYNGLKELINSTLN